MRLPRSLPDRYAAERSLAPHVDPAWAEAVLLELRVLGVDGTRIGAALAEVDSHCAESGQSAADAFGDPTAYARSLDLPAAEDISLGGLVRTAAATLIQVLGMLLAVPAVTAWRSGDLLEVTLGMLVSLGLVVALSVAAAHQFGRVLRVIVSRPLLGWLATMALIGLSVAALTLLPDVVAHLPAEWAAAAAGVLLVAGSWWSATQIGATPTDAVVGPLDSSPTGAGGRRVADAVARVLTVGLVPVVTALMLALTWALSAAD